MAEFVISTPPVVVIDVPEIAPPPIVPAVLIDPATTAPEEAIDFVVICPRAGTGSPAICRLAVVMLAFDVIPLVTVTDSSVVTPAESPLLMTAEETSNRFCPSMFTSPRAG